MARYRSTYCPYCKAPITIHEDTGWIYYEHQFGEPIGTCNSCHKTYNTSRKYWSKMDYSDKILVFIRFFLAIAILVILLSIVFSLLLWLLTKAIPSLTTFVDLEQSVTFIVTAIVCTPLAIFREVKELNSLIKQYP